MDDEIEDDDEDGFSLWEYLWDFFGGDAEAAQEEWEYRMAERENPPVDDDYEPPFMGLP